MTTARIDRRFAQMKAEGRAAFVAYLVAGDPDKPDEAVLPQATSVPAAPTAPTPASTVRLLSTARSWLISAMFPPQVRRHL